MKTKIIRFHARDERQGATRAPRKGFNARAANHQMVEKANFHKGKRILQSPRDVFISLRRGCTTARMRGNDSSTFQEQSEETANKNREQAPDFEIDNGFEI